VSEAGFGPSFASIAANYSGQADADQRLAKHIAHGFGHMPPGLASDAQAAKLAKLILELPATSRP
ncbi:MAG: cytochrome C', partial [Caldimonas sp.]